jgi:serine protease AprX
MRPKAVWGPKSTLIVAALMILGLAPNAMADGYSSRHRHYERAKAGEPNSSVREYRLDGELTLRSTRFAPLHTTRAIVELKPGKTLPPEFAAYATSNGQLGIIDGQVVDVPDSLLKKLAESGSVLRVHYDRPAAKFNYRTSLTVGTRDVQQTLGLTGAGIGIAIIDSGIASWHDDLTNTSSKLYPYGNQRVKKFVDFVGNRTAPYDDDGHGTHVAGIIAGNGYDSDGKKMGAAPDASLIVLKVLDSNGNGTVSNIIAALNWVLANRTTYNIRVVNMSVGAAIHESAYTDPLTLAAKRVVDAGIVVVGAAGNFGTNTAGLPQYGGISAPGNAPWVLTVGGSSTNGTPQRNDDLMGTYSSRGPTYIDFGAKPDLVAPGTGTVSLASPGSNLNLANVLALLPGTRATASLPYLSLTGTSMAAPVVSGVVALMLQANPTLTPNAVKAILEYTAQQYPGYNALEQGAGFLNAVGAIRVARFYKTAQPGDRLPPQAMWSKHVIWGNHLMSHRGLDVTSNAFATGTTWGGRKSSAGENIVWGTASSDENIVWGTSTRPTNIVWGTAATDENIVWGTDCGGDDCDKVVWGSSDSENIVWGTAADGENIVWGTAASDENIVWGTAAFDENIVWGTASVENIVWGTARGGLNIVWGTAAGGENIVWGTAAGSNNIVWGTAPDSGGNVVWGAVGSVSPAWSSAPNGTQTALTGSQLFDRLKDEELLQALACTPPPSPPLIPPPLAVPPVVKVLTPVLRSILYSGGGL